ncbi:hypothetical protein [Fusobacterium nucleatum]|uniref:hypothetical protein n=1 Tax=Fusobacterium nucleatum TaxID=851 RepID=UPI00235E3487|nr:hypothetical protein [Fusobacterium nucleatum]WDA46447.1 hypothetical protein PSR67_02735 [Fusobacterium nucleatum]
MEDKQEEILKIKKIKEEKISILKILVGLIIVILPFILAFITAYFIWKDEINTVFNEIFG